MMQSAGSLRHFIMDNFHQLVQRKLENGLDAIVSKHDVTSQMGGESECPTYGSGESGHSIVLCLIMVYHLHHRQHTHSCECICLSHHHCWASLVTVNMPWPAA